MKKYSNMAEFAAELNLARSTVSYILNDKWKERNISPETVRRVRDYAREVNFVPNFFGRAIKGKVRAETALLLPVNAYFHHRDAFFRLLEKLTESGNRYLVLPVSPGEAPEKVLEQLLAYSVRRVMVIAAPLFRDGNIPSWHAAVAATPQVQWLFYDFPQMDALSGLLGEANVSTVGFDRRKAVEKICDYVWDAGFEELLCFGMTPSDSRLRIVPLELKRPLPSSGLPETAGTLAEALLGLHRKEGGRAVFIHDDLLTAGTLQTLLERGVRVPEEFAFISWDGLKISRFFRKSLTTLAVPHDRMLDAALDFLSGVRPSPSRLEVEPSIREGESMPRNSSR